MAAPPPIPWTTVASARRALEAREASAEELTRACLGRIEALEPQLHALLCVSEEQALVAAREADARRARGERGPLLGIPMVVKDILATRGLPTTCASAMLEGFVPPYDAEVVARLRRAGAVLLGKANLDEFAMGSSNENSAFGPARNPWDPERVPGGSSGGSAAAVAALECLASLGTDTGGSVRLPASFCGVSAIKPTYGRVSRSGVVAYASSLDQVGPFARTAADLADVLAVIAGADPRDSTCAPAPVPDYARALGGDLRGVRIGLPREYFIDGVDEEVRRATDAAIEEMRGLGASTVEVSLPHTEYAIAAYYLIATAEASSNLARYDGVKYGLRQEREGGDLLAMYQETRDAGFGREVKRRILLGTYALSAGYYDAYYRKAQKVRTLVRQDFERAFSECDLLATPTAPSPAFRLGERVADPVAMYLSDVFTTAPSLAGIPGLVVPCGASATGLPIGLQLLAPPLAEERLLRAGDAFQRATDWHERVPPLAGGADA